MSKYIDGTRTVYFDDATGNLTVPGTLAIGSLSTTQMTTVSSLAVNTSSIRTNNLSSVSILTNSLTANSISSSSANISSLVANNVSTLTSRSGTGFVTSLSTPVANISSLTTPGKLTISTIRNDETVTAGFLHYNTVTNEVVYNAQGGSGGGGGGALLSASTIIGTQSMVAPTQFYAQELYTNAIYESAQFCKQFTTTGPSVTWCGIAVSATGQYMTAVDNGPSFGTGGYIYSSSNFGTTWTQVGSQQGWGSVAMSASGQIQVAAVGLGPNGYAGQLYISNNYGATWTLLSASPTTFWASITMSASGQYIVGTDNASGFNTAGYAYISSNYGTTWSIITSLPFVVLGPLRVSASGQYQTVTGQGIAIYRSTDYGQSWSAVGISDRYAGVAISASGQYQTATSFTFDGGSGSIYVSADYGATWTVYGSTGLIYRQPAISASGQFQALYVINSGMYYSTNYGITWTFISAPNAFLYGIAMSAAANYLVVVARDPQQRIYINSSRLLLQNVVTNSLATSSLTATNDIVAGRNFFSQNTLNTNVLNLSGFSQSFSLVNSPGTFNYTSAVSATGQYQLVGTTTYLYVSSDFGNTWTQVATAKDWTGVAVSGNGNFMYATDATASTGNLYRSTDYGLTWVVVPSSPGAGSWVFVAISASGQYVLSCGPSYYFISSNYGASFSQVENYPCQGHVTMSATGQYMMLRGSSTNLLSSNYGATWTAISPASDGYAMAISGTGQYQMAVDTPTVTLYISSDYGATFTASLVGANFWSCAIDYTGQYQVISQVGINKYYSVDYGVTWTVVANIDPAQSRNVSMSANAQYLLIPNTNGPFYLNRSSVWFPAGISTATAQVSSLTTNSVLFEKPYFSWQTQGTQLANNFVQTSLLSNLNISSGLFTLECYFNPTATNTYWGTIVSLNNGTTNNGNEFRITQRVGADGFGMLFPITSGSADGFSNIGITILPTDSWYHIALVRTSATNLFLYSNGTAILSTTTLNYSQNQNMQLQIFRSPYNDDIGQGYIQSVRFTAGQALYTGNFTPPTQQLTRNSVGTSGAGTASQITGTVAFLGGVTSTFTDVGPFALALTAGTSNTTTNTVPSTFSSIFLTTFGNHLGINCNSPSFTLDVNGSANFNGIVNFDNLPENNVLINSASQQILLSNTASTYMYMQAPGNRIRIGAYSNASPMLFTINESGGNVSIGSSSTTSFALYLLGNMYASGTITSNSDERVKEDIMNADTSMCYSTMQNIELKYFKWKPSFQSNCYIQDSHQLGFIAQDVKKVFPNSVSISPMHGYDDFHAMESGQLNAMHYGATKKLMSVVERQTAQLVEQSTQMAQLLADNSTLTNMCSYIPQLINTVSTLKG